MPRCFGLDVKGGYLLCAEAVYFGDEVQSMSLSYGPVPEGAMTETGEWAEGQLAELLQNNLGPGLDGDTIAVSLEGQDVITRTTAARDLPPKALQQALLAEVMEFKPMEGKTIALDYRATGVSQKVDQMEDTVLELAINEEKTQPWQEAIAAVNPKGAVLESALLSLLRLYMWTRPPQDRGQVVLLVEDGVTQVVNLQAGSVRFIRAFEIGATALAQSAEARGMGQGLTPTEEDFLDETVRTVRYLYTTFTDQSFEPTVHLLARSYVPGQLAGVLSEQLGLSVEVVDPFFALGVANLSELEEAGVDPWLFTQAMGAALYAVCPEILPLNVFNQQVFQKRELIRSAIYMLSPVAAAVVLPLVLGFVLKGRANKVTRERDEAQVQLATLSALALKKPVLENALRYLTQKTRSAPKITGGTDWPRFVYELTNLFPERTWLQEIRYTRENRTIIFVGLTADPKMLYALEKNLKASPFLEQVNSEGADDQAPFEGDTTPILKFTISALLKVKEPE